MRVLIFTAIFDRIIYWWKGWARHYHNWTYVFMYSKRYYRQLFTKTEFSLHIFYNSLVLITKNSVQWEPMGKQIAQAKWSHFATLRRLLKVNTKSNTTAKRHYSQCTTFSVLLFETLYHFNACDVTIFFFFFVELGRLYGYESRSGRLRYVR
jgi:hypothetical protein